MGLRSEVQHTAAQCVTCLCNRGCFTGDTARETSANAGAKIYTGADIHGKTSQNSAPIQFSK